MSMKLNEWLREQKVTQREFVTIGKKHGGDFSYHAVTKWCSGQRIPRSDEMVIIHKATEKKVAPNDFYILQ